MQFQSKKAIAESPLGGQAAVVSPSYEVETAVTPSLDRRKAVRQHVRALNTEFARSIFFPVKFFNNLSVGLPCMF